VKAMQSKKKKIRILRFKSSKSSVFESTQKKVILAEELQLAELDLKTSYAAVGDGTFIRNELVFKRG
jgi:hypothetical protein